MPQLLQTSFAGPAIHSTSLQSTINHLLRHSLSDLLRSSNSSVMNEIPAEFPVIADGKRIIPVIQELLATVLTNAKKGRIHIRAERFQNIIILEIQDQNGYNAQSVMNSIKALGPIAKSAGGNISIKGKQELETIITFSFQNQSAEFNYNS